MGAGKQFTKDDLTGEKMSLKGTVNNPDAGLVSALTGEGGVLAAGIIPEMGVADPKAFAEAVSSGNVTKTKPPKPAKVEKAEEVGPTSVKENPELN